MAGRGIIGLLIALPLVLHAYEDSYCRRTGVDFVYSNIANATGYTWDTCLDYCLATDGCVSLVFRSSDSRCYAKNSVYDINEETVDSSYDSANIACYLLASPEVTVDSEEVGDFYLTQDDEVELTCTIDAAAEGTFLLQWYTDTAVTYVLEGTVTTNTSDDVYVQIVGKSGRTEKLKCADSTFSSIASGDTANCTVSSNIEIGNYSCVTWTISGSDEFQLSNFKTYIDGSAQTDITPAGSLDSSTQSDTWCIGTEPASVDGTYDSSSDTISKARNFSKSTDSGEWACVGLYPSNYKLISGAEFSLYNASLTLDNDVSIELNYGASQDLTCIFDSDNADLEDGEVKVEWTFSNTSDGSVTSLNSTDVLSGDELESVCELSSVKVADAGYYTCTFSTSSHSSGSLSKTTTISVQDLTITYDISYIIPGETTITFTCNCEGTVESDCTVNWYDSSSTELSAGVGATTWNSTSLTSTTELELAVSSNATVTSIEGYSCTSDQTGNDLAGTVSVAASYLVGSITGDDMTGRYGNEVYLSCVLDTGNTNASESDVAVWWQYEDSTGSAQNISSGIVNSMSSGFYTTNLTLSGVTMADENTYTCVFTLDGGSLNDTVELTVIDLSISTSEEYVIKGDQVRLECRCASETESVCTAVSWTDDDASITADDDNVFSTSGYADYEETLYYDRLIESEDDVASLNLINCSNSGDGLNAQAAVSQVLDLAFTSTSLTIEKGTADQQITCELSGFSAFNENLTYPTIYIHRDNCKQEDIEFQNNEISSETVLSFNECVAQCIANISNCEAVAYKDSSKTCYYKSATYDETEYNTKAGKHSANMNCYTGGEQQDNIASSDVVRKVLTLDSEKYSGEVGYSCSILDVVDGNVYALTAATNANITFYGLVLQTSDWVSTSDFVHDLQETPLQFRTYAVAGDDTTFSVTFQDASTSDMGSFSVMFYDELMYKLDDCEDDWTNFTTSPPSDHYKLWTITKTSANLTVECNDVEVLHVNFSSVSSGCSTTYSDDVENIGDVDHATIRGTHRSKLESSTSYFTGSSNTQYVAAGEEFSAICIAFGDSNTTNPSWTYSGTAVSDIVNGTYDSDTSSISTNMTFSNVSTADEGTYLCTHSESASLTQFLTVDVYEVEATGAYALAGIETVLSCSFSEFSSDTVTGDVSFTWIRENGTEIETTSVVEGYTVEVIGMLDSTISTTLTIAGGNVTEDETFSCRIKMLTGLESEHDTELELDVFTIETTGRHVQVGSGNITLTCLLDGIDGDAAEIQWSAEYPYVTSYFTTGGGIVVDEGNVSSGQQETTLTLTESYTLEDTVFTCSVISNGETFADTVNLDVFEIETENNGVPQGTSSELTCIIVGLNDTATFTGSYWSYGDVEVGDNSTVTNYEVTKGDNTTVFEIDGSQVTDDSVWLCSVTVDGANYSANASSSVFNFSSNVPSSRQDTSATITCLLGELESSATDARWKYATGDDLETYGYSDELSKRDDDEQQTILTIDSNKTENATGSYSCEVEVDGIWYSNTVEVMWFEIDVTAEEGLVGLSETMTCTVTYIWQAPSTISWTIEGVGTIDKDSDMDGYTVSYDASTFDSAEYTITSTIVVTDPQDDTSYTCNLVTSETGEMYGEEEVLHVHGIETHNTATLQGVEVKLTCLVYDYLDTANWDMWNTEWHRDGVTVDSDDFVVDAAGSVLTVSDPQEDTTYTCLFDIDGDGNYESRTLLLDVFTLTAVSDIVTEADDATPKCYVGGFDLDVDAYMIWFKNTDFIIESTGLLKINTVNDDVRRVGTVCNKNFTDDTALAICQGYFGTSGFAMWDSNTVYAYASEEATSGENIVLSSLTCASDATSLAECTLNFDEDDECLTHETDIVLFCNGDTESPDLNNEDDLSSSWDVTYDTLSIHAGSISEDTDYICGLNIDLGFSSESFYAAEKVNVDLISTTYRNYIKEDGSQFSMTCFYDNIDSDFTLSGFSWTSTSPAEAGSDYALSVWKDLDSTDRVLKAWISNADSDVHEGMWSGSIQFTRDEELSVFRTITKTLYLDVPGFDSEVFTDFVTENSGTAEFTCSSRTTSQARSLNPIYSWSLNGENVTHNSDVNNAGDSVLVLEAVGADEDGDVVQCTANYNTDDEDTAIHTDRALYVYGVEYGPSTEVFGVVSEALEFSCVVTGAQPYIESITWKTEEYGELTENVNYWNEESDPSAFTVSTLNISSAHKSDEMIYTCVIKFNEEQNVPDYTVVFDLVQVFAITEQPEMNKVVVTSGYSTEYTVEVEGDVQYFPHVTYVWYVNSDILETDSMSDSYTSTVSTGQLFYTADSSNLYSVKVVWHGTYQSLTTTSITARVGIIDSCKITTNVEGSLNSDTILDNSAGYVEDGTVVSLSCSQGWIQPQPVTTASYSETCSTDNDITFSLCIGGNYILDPNTVTTFSFEVSSTDDSGYTSQIDGDGFTTVHKGTKVVLSCSTGYTLREAWAGYIVCDESDGSECAPDGLCVKGCEYSRNNYTDTQFQFSHGKDLVADQDGITYACIDNHLTKYGADYYRTWCIGDKTNSTLELDECQEVQFESPEIHPGILSVELIWDDVTYPVILPEYIEAMLMDSAGTSLLQTATTTHTYVVFNELEPNTNYTVQLRLHWEAGSYDDVTQSFTTMDTYADNVELVSSETTWAVEVPFTPYEVASYDIIGVYMSSEYTGNTDTNNFEYVYVDDESNIISKRDAVDTVIIYVYPTADDLFDADVIIGGFLADQVSATEMGSAQVYTVDVTTIQLTDDATYFVMVRACNEDDLDDCMTGAATKYTIGKDWRLIISTCLLVPLGIIVVVLFVYLCFKTRLRYMRRSAMDHEPGEHEMYYKGDNRDDKKHVPVEIANSLAVEDLDRIAED